MKKHIFIILLLLISEISLSDSFNYNSLNNHGVIGLINMPTARFYDESSYGITLYDGDPDQKITLTSSSRLVKPISSKYSNISIDKFLDIFVC